MAFKLSILAFLTLSTAAAQEFHLKDGDRVVFYGDSITDCAQSVARAGFSYILFAHSRPSGNPDTLAAD